MIASALVTGGANCLYEPFNPRIGPRNDPRYNPPSLAPKWMGSPDRLSRWSWAQDLPPQDNQLVIKTLFNHHARRKDQHAGAFASLITIANEWADLVMVTKRNVMHSACSHILAKHVANLADWNGSGRCQGTQPGSIQWEEKFGRVVQAAMRADKDQEQFMGFLKSPVTILPYTSIPDFTSLKRHLSIMQPSLKVGEPFTHPSERPILDYFSHECLKKIASLILSA